MRKTFTEKQPFLIGDQVTALKPSYQLIQTYRFPQQRNRKIGNNFRESTIGNNNNH